MAFAAAASVAIGGSRSAYDGSEPCFVGNGRTGTENGIGPEKGENARRKVVRGWNFGKREDSGGLRSDEESPSGCEERDAPGSEPGPSGRRRDGSNGRWDR